MIYKNGIKGRKSQMKTIKLNSIRLNPDNPRLIRDGKFKKLVESIKRDPEFLEKRGIVHADGVILGGNQRYLAIKEALKDDAFRGDLPKGEIPASWVQDASDWPEEKRRRFIILDNASFGEMDFDILANLFSDLPLVDLGVDLPEDWLKGEETVADAEPQIDRAEELNKIWRVKSGDLWQIGEHRLLCGDSTKKEDVARVMGNDKPLLMVTDPPYGVEYESKKGAVTNDDRSEWKESYDLFQGAVAYVWHGERSSLDVGINLRDSGFEIRARVIWVKPSITMGRGHYHFQHEGAWYAVRKGNKSGWIGDHKQSSVWQIDRDDKLHPTVKPLECMARPIRNHEGDVYDPFLGSGTTMVACQNLNRKCRGIEISPDYCAVILQRMTDAFPGIEIRRIE